MSLNVLVLGLRDGWENAEARSLSASAGQARLHSALELEPPSLKLMRYQYTTWNKQSKKNNGTEPSRRMKDADWTMEEHSGRSPRCSAGWASGHQVKSALRATPHPDASTTANPDRPALHSPAEISISFLLRPTPPGNAAL